MKQLSVKIPKMLVDKEEAEKYEVVKKFEQHDCHLSLEDRCKTCENYFRFLDKLESRRN